MARKLTIPCDRCGARLENIPEKCPHCGEIIYDRMDPFIRERIEELMQKGRWKKYIPLFLTYSFFIPFAVSAWFVHFYFDRYDTATAASAAAFCVVSIVYISVMPRMLRNISAYHLMGHAALFSLAAISGVFLFPNVSGILIAGEILKKYSYPNDWALLNILVFSIIGVIALARFLLRLNRTPHQESKSRLRWLKPAVLFVATVLFCVFATDIWFMIQGLRARYAKSSRVIHSLEMTHDDRASIALFNALDNPALDVLAVKTLGKIGDERAVLPLVNAFKETQFEELRWSIIYALGEIGDNGAVDFLLGILDDNSSLLHYCAIKALGEIGDNRALEPIISKMKSYPMEVIIALGKFGDHRSVEYFLKEADLKSTNGNFVSYGSSKPDRDIFRAIGWMKDKKATDILLDILLNRSLFVLARDRLIEAIGEIGDNRAVEPLLNLFDNGQHMRLIAIELGSFGDRRALPSLMNAMENHPDAITRFLCALSLNYFNDDKVDNALIKAERNGNSGASFILSWRTGNDVSNIEAPPDMSIRLTERFIIRSYSIIKYFLLFRWGNYTLTTDMGWDIFEIIFEHLYEQRHFFNPFLAEIITIMPEGFPPYDANANYAVRKKQTRAIMKWYYKNKSRLAWNEENKRYYLQ
jgi:HEAT repeat protein